MAIDSLGVRHRFPLNGQPTAPAVIANVLDLSPNPFPRPGPMAWIVYDGEGRALVKASLEAFDPLRVEVFARAARLKHEQRTLTTREEVTAEQMAPRDAVKLYRVPPLSRTVVVVYSVVWVVALALAVLATADVVSWLAVAAWLVVVLTARAAWRRLQRGGGERTGDRGKH